MITSDLIALTLQIIVSVIGFLMLGFLVSRYRAHIDNRIDELRDRVDGRIDGLRERVNGRFDELLASTRSLALLEGKEQGRVTEVARRDAEDAGKETN